MIPLMPVLSCFFKEIWHLDNRQYKEVIKNINTSIVTDIVIAGGYNNEIKYLKDNFR
jgi:hypothetical protein